MNKILILIIGIFLINLIGVSSNSLMSFTTGVIQDVNGVPITGDLDLSIEIWDAQSPGGNLVYNATYIGNVTDSRVDVMLGKQEESGSLTPLNLTYGEDYYMDIKINYTDLDFNGLERQQFQAHIGNITTLRLDLNDTLHTQSLVPKGNISYDLGSSNNWWNNIYVNTINLMTKITGTQIADLTITAANLVYSTITSDKLDLTNITLSTFTNDASFLTSTQLNKSYLLIGENKSAMDYDNLALTNESEHFDENLSIEYNLTVGGNILYVDSVLGRVGINQVDEFDPRIGLSIVGDLDINHTSTEADDHALEIDVDAVGFGDVKALDIFYDTGTISTGKDEGIILINIDESEATGGDVFGLEVLATEGSASIYGLKVGVLINPIGQFSGIFGDMDSANTSAGGDTLAAFTSTSTDVTMFASDNDNVTIGNAVKFEEIEFLLDTVASGAGIKPTFYYSTGVGTWSEFTPTDGTNGIRNNGVILWDDDDIPSWAVGIGDYYLIRIQRTANALSTVPIEDKVQISSITEYKWTKEGWLNIRNATINEDFIVDTNTLYVDSAGNNVGIGTTTPSTALDVRGIGNFSGTVYINNDTDLSTFLTSSQGNYTYVLQQEINNSYALNTSLDNYVDWHNGNITYVLEDVINKSYTLNTTLSQYVDWHRINDSYLLKGENASYMSYTNLALTNETNVFSTDQNFSTGILLTNLTNCDSLDTNTNGLLICGTDSTGAGWTDVDTLMLLNNTAFINMTHLDSSLDIANYTAGTAMVILNHVISSSAVQDYTNIALTNESTVFGEDVSFTKLLDKGNLTVCGTGEILKESGGAWTCAADADTDTLMVYDNLALTNTTETFDEGINISKELRALNLINCDSIDTDASGNLSCGIDATGTGWQDSDTLLLKNESGIVNTTHIVERTITKDDLADSSINSTHIIDDQVTASDIADSAIDAAAKIVDHIISITKLAWQSITADYIADEAINTTHIKDGTILTDDLSFGIGDTNVSNICGDNEVLLGQDTKLCTNLNLTISAIDTNVTTKCSGSQLLAGNGTCIPEANLLDDTDTDTLMVYDNIALTNETETFNEDVIMSTSNITLSQDYNISSGSGYITHNSSCWIILGANSRLEIC